ncbi:MAG: hypothetical protein ACXVJW_14620 [Acidimicrobiia bacterium]
MARGKSAGAVEPRDALRDQTVDDLDELIEVVIEARKSLDAFQSALEKTRRHLAGGGRASDMAALFDVPAIRWTLTDAISETERARTTSRVSLWRLQIAEGTTIAEVARIWGLSRQLVSRAPASSASRGSAQR